MYNESLTNDLIIYIEMKRILLFFFFEGEKDIAR